MTTTTTTTFRSTASMPRSLRLALWGALACVFLIPVMAKLVDPGMLWSGGDFVVAGVALALLGALIEGGYRMSDRWSYRFAVIGAALVSFLLVWINLAVGFIGNEANPINQAYLAMPLFALVAGAMVRFRAQPMAAIMLALAAAQIAIAVIGQPEQAAVWRATFVFASAWTVAAALFWTASRN